MVVMHSPEHYQLHAKPLLVSSHSRPLLLLEENVNVGPTSAALIEPLFTCEKGDSFGWKVQNASLKMMI